MKISNIRSELDAAATVHSNHSTSATSANCFQPSLSLGFFSNFELLSKDSVKKLVLGVPMKSCSLDPVPTKVVKECLDELVPLLTVIINQSLQSGVFPDVWKEALVTPTLKKCGSDLAFKNFRPISNLQFVSKLVERAAADQLQSHLVKNNLFPTLQSAYRPNHSTETALLKIKNDILMNMDKQHATLLILLDLSAAFDTVDHQILLNRLRTDFGVSGKVLDWFASYLSNRSQKVTVDGVLSDWFGIDFGVPQGSCLGPLLFVIYSSKLFNIVNRHLPNVHAYADDTQLYLAFKPGNYANETAAVSSIQSCIRDLQIWMLMDKLKLNPEKTISYSWN